MKEDYKFKLLGIDPAVPGGDRSVPPARQEGETPPYSDICNSKDALLAELLRRDSELSAKQAEVDQWKEIANDNQRESISKTEKINYQYREITSMKAEVEETQRCFGESQQALAVEIEEVERLRAELESLKAAQGWNPIETAPKDGSNILSTWIDTWADAPHIESVTWSEDHWFYTYDGDSPQKGNEPTHWMPLPTPPVERSVDGE